jgi:hypothetical protein
MAGLKQISVHLHHLDNEYHKSRPKRRPYQTAEIRSLKPRVQQYKKRISLHLHHLDINNIMF